MRLRFEPLGGAVCLLLVWACGGETDRDTTRLDLRALPVAAETSSIFVHVRRDARSCPPPRCGGLLVRRVNFPSTPCADGRPAAECYIGDVDLAGLALEASQQAEIRATPETFLLRGFLGPVLPGSLDTGLLRVTEAWQGQVGVVPLGTLLRVTPSGEACRSRACTSLRASALNQDEPSLPVASVVLPDGAAASARVAAQLAAPEGLLVAGELDRAAQVDVGGEPLKSGDAGPPAAPAGNVLRASEYYLPFPVQPEECSTDSAGCGCSSTLHSGECSSADAAAPIELDAGCDVADPK